MENYQLIASLGSAGPGPEIVPKLERGEEPHPRDPPGWREPTGPRQSGVPPAPSLRLPRRRFQEEGAQPGRAGEAAAGAGVAPPASPSSVAKLFGTSKSHAGRSAGAGSSSWPTGAPTPTPCASAGGRAKAGGGGRSLRLVVAGAGPRRAPLGAHPEAKARELARSSGRDSEATEGWWRRWESRHNVVFKRQEGEKVETDIGSTQSWVSEVLPPLLAGYWPQGIVSTAETGLLYCGYPGRAQTPGTSRSWVARGSASLSSAAPTSTARRSGARWGWAGAGGRGGCPRTRVCCRSPTPARPTPW
ncbi:uncharacterized protein LOC141738197 [Larus michahellis]|uniref:uncharacterized protein LOC141738197 n=1 Tax=Larus michahellis TaxID=119627 RepID=UPI003D9B8C2D